MRTRMVGAGKRDRRQQGFGLHRNHSKAGSASSPSTPGADRPASQCGSRRLHRCGTRDRVDASSAPAGCQRSRATRKPRLFRGGPQVRLLDVPTRVDRAEGDIHPAGNPHIQTDPRNIATVAAALTRRMGELDQADAATFAAQAQNFAGRWTAAMQRWTQRAAPFRGTTVAAYHKSWTYLEDWLGLREAATIEPKPGIPPGSQHLAQLVADLPAKNVRAILYSAYEDPRGSEFVAQRIGATAVMLPFTVGGTDRAKDLFRLFDDTIERLSGPLAGAAVGKR